MRWRLGTDYIVMTIVAGFCNISNLGTVAGTELHKNCTLIPVKGRRDDAPRSGD